MTTRTIRSLLALTTAAAVTLLAATPASADDTELFVGDAVAAPPTRPNVLFVLDTSGSMQNTLMTQEDWSASTTYSGSCDSTRIYWSRTGTPPSCTGSGSEQYIDNNRFSCNAARPALNSAGIAAVERAAQWYPASRSSQRRWRQLTSGDHSNWVDCAPDQGVHGSYSSPTPNRYARDGSSGPYSSTSTPWPSGGETSSVTFFTGNYINWLNGGRVSRTRLHVVRSAMSNLLDTLEDGSVNVGLMRYSNDRSSLPDASDGGMVVEAMGTLDAAKRASMKATIATWIPKGSTPLTETLYEASLYFRGEPVYWGLNSDQCYNSQDDCPFSPNPVSDTPSVLASRLSSDPTLYDSPADEDCQRNYIVYLTDGLPQSDSNADSLIRGLPRFAEINGYATCTGGPTIASDGDGTGQCLDELARWMNESDLRPDRPGVQNVTTYWIGFGTGVAAGTASLQHVAARGGGRYYSAADTAELSTAFTSIISRILEQSTTFTAPAVAVNAFNRTQNLNYLYMSLFKPAASYRWIGNIKKYRVTPTGTIVDSNGNSAVDATTGFFTRSSQSYWSDAEDGADAALGGAAGELTNPAGRNVYSNLTITSGLLSAEPLSALKNPANLTLANTLLLGTTTPDGTRPSVVNLVDWAYGYDVQDDDGDSDTTEARLDMGDPLHSRPATVVYGGPADDPLLVLYVTTNDGMLQAINAATGAELWSFMPREMLRRVESLYENDEVTGRVYGLDGDIEVVRLDRNNNGTIEPAGTDIDSSGTIEEDEKDKVLLFFGMRRGGSHYYALDVTTRTAPRLLWSIGPSQLPNIGQTWSTPTVARINVDRTWPSSNPDKMVLVFGGGYDTVQDTIGYVADSVGTGVYIVDALTGTLIWRAGPDAGADLRLTNMTNSIPGEVRPLDLTGDGYADRIYAADLGGRIWRFDIRNGEEPDELVWGGVFASLGLGDTASPTDSTQARRFFYAPDVSLINTGTSNFINVAIGSGHRELPITDETVVNRFYSLRDYNVFTRIQTGQYKTTCGASETLPCHQIITDSDSRLVDVTSTTTPTIPAGSIGWRMGFGDDGEKVLAESRTFQNAIYFTTYSPQERAYNPEYCVATVGLNRLYVVDAATSRPVRNLDASTPAYERSRELLQGSIAPPPTFIFPTPAPDPDDPTRPMPAVEPFCLIGLESCGTGLANPPVRTYWEQRGAN